MVKWERFLPRVSVRVLLVESDDSTRQIIAALLRKCSYRVSAVSDGLKAWEILKEKSHNIDLVLTEVELPSISGLALLTLTMDHETCKNIPVIMMSSHDSLSMVFKCMLKGAADFLVKPLRKNELRNLWQHVWRRHISSRRHGCTNGHQDEILGKKKLDNHSREYVACMQENKECSEKGSDAQSSCTRSDMEAESRCTQNMLDIKQSKSRNIALMGDTVAQKGEEHIQSESASLMHEGEAEDNSIMLGSEMTPFDGVCNSSEPTLEERCTCAVIQTTNKEKPSKEIIDLIGAIDNQSRGNAAVQNALSDASEILFHEKDVKCKSSSIPLLELSLRRYQQSSCDKPENDEWNTLNHSNSSAFSLYANTSRTAVPTSLMPMNSGTEHKPCFSTSTKALPDQGSGNTSNTPCCNGVTPKVNTEDTKSLGLGLPGQEGMAVQCSPLRVIPFPIPIRGTTLDSLCAGYGTVMQNIYYPQASHPLWSTIPSMWQEAVHTSSSRQSGPKDFSPVQNYHPGDQSPKSLIDHPSQQQEEIKELGDEHRHVSSVTDESGISSMCNVSGSLLNISGSGSLRDSKGNFTAATISKANPECENGEGQFSCEGIKPTDLHHFNQREAALNKFRLKRKDRCFEKKVRYHSRKRLAEQRPRVKGQFVRQVQPDSRSMEAGCYSCDSAAG